MDRSVDLHVKVIRAIRNGDGPAAASAMSDLLNHLSD